MTAASTSDARKRNASPVDPVEVVARAITTAIGEDFDDNDSIDQALALDCGRDVVNALRENGFTL